MCSKILNKITQKFFVSLGYGTFKEYMLPSSNDIFDIFPANRVPIIKYLHQWSVKITDYIIKIMTPKEGLQLPDTDLFVDELYSLAPDLGIF